MIDLHSHILPGIDDGPKTMAESLELARLYVAAGFAGVVATPHFIQGTPFAADADVVNEGVAGLKAALKANGIPLDVYAGMEIALDAGLPELLEHGTLLCLAETRYVLIEAPFQRLPINWLQIVSGIRSRGHAVVLAHPERCMELGRRPELFREIIDAGIYLQANYDSFIGSYGSTAAETAFYLLGNGFVHFLATDSHDPVRRNPARVNEAIAAVEQAAGAERVEILTRLNPRRLIEGLPLEAPKAIESNKKKKRRWFRF